MEELGSCFVVEDSGQDEARRIAANVAKLPELLKKPKAKKDGRRPTGASTVARRWGSIVREAARTTAFVASFGLIAYFGMNAVIKIEATRTRLFLVCVVFGVAFAAAALLDHLLRHQVPTDTQPNGEPTEIWPRWYSQFGDPLVYRQSDRVPYSYVVLPRPR